MKKALFFLCLISSITVFGQAKKPTIMVVPSDAWCIKNGYSLEFNDNGSKIIIPDYAHALRDNTDLLLVMSKLNGLMAERGFPLKNLETVLKSINSYAAEDGLMNSNEGGEISESPVDLLKSVAKADIIMQLTWSINQTGPKKSITFNLQGLDTYSSKQIATAVGTGAPSFSAELPVLLEEAVISHIDHFSASLQNHFDDMFKNGREVTIRIKRWDNWNQDLESLYGPNQEELGLIIEDWIAVNTIEGRFTTLDATENMMVFEQVRIPLYYERNGRTRSQDTRNFIRGLSDFLKAAPYNIENKVTTRGLGEATIILGSN